MCAFWISINVIFFFFFCEAAPLLCCALRMLHLICGGTRWLASPGHGAVALQHTRFCRTDSFGQIAHVEEGFPDIRSYLTLATVYLEITFSWIILFTFVISARRSRLWWNVIAFKAQAVRKFYIFISHPSRACHPSNCNSFCLWR